MEEKAIKEYEKIKPGEKYARFLYRGKQYKVSVRFPSWFIVESGGKVVKKFLY